MKKANFIMVLGYGRSGSSAVVDLLSEYKSVKVFGDDEFRFIKDPGGLIDLESRLKCNWSALNSSYYIYEFKDLVKRYALKRTRFSRHNYEYNRRFKLDLEKLGNDFADSLISEDWKGYNFLYERKFGSYEYFFEKIKRKLRLSNYKESQVCFLKSDLDYRDKVRDFTSSLHNALTDDPTHSVLLNQGLPTCNPASYHDYFHNVKSIVINRDPRDVFTYTHNRLWMPRDPKIFAKWYKGQMEFAHNQINIESGSVLRLNFEDVILNYKDSVKQIEQFLEIDMKDHILAKKYFNPDISKQNIGLWKGQDKEVNDFLSSELKDYLYKI